MDKDTFSADDFLGQATYVIFLLPFSCAWYILTSVCQFSDKPFQICCTQYSIYVKDLLETGAEKGTAQLHATKYSVVQTDDSYCGEIKVGLSFTSTVINSVIYVFGSSKYRSSNPLLIRTFWFTGFSQGGGHYSEEGIGGWQQSGDYWYPVSIICVTD